MFLTLVMDSFVQQMSRAGREGQSGHHVLIWKLNQLRNMKDVGLLRHIRKEEKCRRDSLYVSYGAPSQISTADKTRCCDRCSSSSERHPVMSKAELPVVSVTDDPPLHW